MIGTVQRVKGIAGRLEGTIRPVLLHLMVDGLLLTTVLDLRVTLSKGVDRTST